MARLHNNPRRDTGPSASPTGPRVSRSRLSPPSALSRLAGSRRRRAAVGPSASWAAPAGHIGRHVFSTQASAEVAMIGGVDGPVRRFYMRTLLASSGSTLGHGPTTRTHAFRRPPKRERGRPRHTHTHTIYAVRRVYSAGVHPVVSPPSPVSHRLASASLAVSEPTDPQPTFSSPESACVQAARACGLKFRGFTRRN